MLDIRLDELRARLGEKFTDDLYTREAHGRDENATPGQPPLAVIYAESVADIQTLLAWANETHTAVIAFGAGTSFEGHIVPQGPAISLDLSRMNRVERIAPEDFPGRGSARRHAHNSEQRAALDRPLLPGRSRSGRLTRRHGVHQRQRHDDRALRRHAKEYRRARRRAGQWRGSDARTPGPQDQQRL